MKRIKRILLVAAGSGAWIAALLTCIWPPDRNPFSNPIAPLLDNAKKKIWKSLDLISSKLFQIPLHANSLIYKLCDCLGERFMALSKDMVDQAELSFVVLSSGLLDSLQKIHMDCILGRNSKTWKYYSLPVRKDKYLRKSKYSHNSLELLGKDCSL